MVVSISVYSSLCIGNIFKADETVVQVLKEDGKPATSQSRMWLYASAALIRHQVRLFENQPDRSRKRPEAFLKGFTGALVTDGYQGYNLLTKVTHCGCWAHARRKWREAMPEGATVKTSSKCSITTRVQIRQAPDWEPA